MENTQVCTQKGGGVYQEARKIQIPDLWHLAMYLKDSKNAGLREQADMVLECWHLAHAMKDHIVNER